MAAMTANALPVVERTATIIEFPQRPWWATAPNPACVHWCEVEHKPSEFAQNASLVCQRVIADDARFVVLVESTVRADDVLDSLGDRRTRPFVALHLSAPTEGDMLELLAAHCQANEICAV